MRDDDTAILKNLELAEANIDHIEAINERLLADINRAEAIDEAVRIAQGHTSLAKVSLRGIDVERYLNELAASDDADIQAVEAMLRETYNFAPPTEATTAEVLERIDSLTAKRELAKLGFLEAEDFLRTLEDEIQRCCRADESLAFFRVEVSGARTIADDAQIANALGGFAFLAGDQIGAHGDGYGILMPWMTQAEATTVVDTLGEIVSHAVPQRSVRVGVTAAIPSSEMTATTFPAPAMRDIAQSRTPAVARTVRSR